MWPSDRNIHKIFFMKTIMHTNTSSKTTHSINTSLIKQCYTWYAWPCLNVLLILLLCWYCYSADTVTGEICMLYTTCSMFCAWPIYISLLYHAETMQLLNHVLLKLNNPTFYATLWNHSKHSFFIKSKQFQHDMFSNSKHNLIKHKHFQHDMFSTFCII